MIRATLNRAATRLMNWTGGEAVQSLNLPAPPPRDPSASIIKVLSNALANTKVDGDAVRAMERQEYREFVHEMQEAKALRGSGPWLESDPTGITGSHIRARESDINSQGAMGDFELSLQNADWRREINFSWLQFSRWGIQQIILISRLYYLKNPIIRRLIDVCALYVFARGVEVSSPDKAANDELKAFFARNQTVFGQSALVEAQKAKYYDGNLFWVFFSDVANSGEVNVRMIDAVEVQDIITDPDDTDTPRFFKREWTQRVYDETTGEQSTATTKAWYPALNYDPAVKPDNLGKVPIMWDHPVMHRKCGTVGKWVFGCPRAYPALDWAKASRKFLEACAAVKAALAQIAMQITTKGGQQALAGIKQQLETTVGTGNSGWWDQNPTAVNGSIFASGPGTTLAAFKSQGQGGDPEEVRQYKLMCCMCFGVPETFLSDVSTGNLATATSLDRPTELMFLAEQEAWREDLVRISQFVLSVGGKATNGKLREAHKATSKALVIREARRVTKRDGSWKYRENSDDVAEQGVIEIAVTFPAIREGDIPALVTSTVDAMTLGNRGGQVTGIDEKAGVRKLYEIVGIEDGDELAEEQYPEGEYDANRAVQKLAAPIGKAAPSPGGVPQIGPDGKPIKPNVQASPGVKEALKRLVEAIDKWK